MSATLTFVIGCAAGGAAAAGATAAALRARSSRPEPDPTLPETPRARHVSPHFLNNALAAVSSFVEVDPPRASAMLADLGEYLRYALDENRRRVSLSDELEFVRVYVRIERARFGERVDVRITTDERSGSAPVDAGVVQAAVQRAVEREHRLGGGDVRIRVAAMGDADGVEVRIDTVAPHGRDEVLRLGHEAPVSAA